MKEQQQKSYHLPKSSSNNKVKTATLSYFYNGEGCVISNLNIQYLVQGGRNKRNSNVLLAHCLANMVIIMCLTHGCKIGGPCDK
jgi:homoserine acetyltransferase